LYKNFQRIAKITNTSHRQKIFTCIWEYNSCFPELPPWVFLYNAWNTVRNSRQEEMR